MQNQLWTLTATTVELSLTGMKEIEQKFSSQIFISYLDQTPV